MRRWAYGVGEAKRAAGEGSRPAGPKEREREGRKEFLKFQRDFQMHLNLFLEIGFKPHDTKIICSSMYAQTYS